MSRDSRWRSFARYTLVGDFDPAHITERIGVQPTEVIKKGSPRPRGPFPFRGSGWYLESDAQEDIPLELQVANILEKLSPSEHIIARLNQEYKSWMYCVMYSYESIPGFSFEPQILLSLGRLHLSLDIVVYDMGSPDEE